jgi:hypothetical protein
LVAAAVAVAVVATVFGPGLLGDRPGGAPSYANDAIEITREGRFLVARIKDPLADRERYTEAFRAVGKEVSITMVPVSPRYVGQLLRSGGSANQRVEVATEFGPTEGGRVDCAAEPQRCTLTIRISVDTTATVEYTFGRAARPGEAIQDPPAPDDDVPPTATGSGSAAGGGK